MGLHYIGQEGVTSFAKFIADGNIDTPVVTIDVDDATTGTSGKTLMLIDYDKSGVTGNGRANVTNGLTISMTDAATNHEGGITTTAGVTVGIGAASDSGSVFQWGFKSTLEGGDIGGTSPNFQSISYYSNVTNGGGKDFLAVSSEDTGDYFSIQTTTHGATTLTTVDDDATAAHFEIAADGNITLDAAGDIKLEPGSGDVTIYDAVNDGNPTVSLGSSATNRFETKALYNSGAQTIDSVDFTTYTTSSTTNDGRYRWFVDEVELAKLRDDAFDMNGMLNAHGNNAVVQCSSSASSATDAGPEINLIMDDGAAMANDHRLGIIQFKGAEDSSNTRTTGAQIEAFCEAAWSASENGARMVFSTTDGNASTSTVLTLDSNKLATFAGDLTVNGDTVTFSSSNSVDPQVIIRNETDDANGPRLRIENKRSADGQDNDSCGTIQFYSYDDGTPTEQQYGNINVVIDDATATEESGKMNLRVATHNGAMREGLVLVGGDESQEVDATIGNGTNSVTTIAGDATVTSKLTAKTRKFEVSSSTDGDYGGDVVYFGGTTSMTTGAIYHYNSSGNWELADADDNTKSDGLLGVALGAASDTNGVLLRGMVTIDHDPGAIGDVLYLTTTAGDCSATAPSGNGNIVRIIGYQVSHASNGNIWFNPDSTFVEVNA